MVTMGEVSSGIRVLIVDDDPLVRAGLTLILGAVSDISIVGEGADGDEGAALALQLRPDVVLMDIRMPVRDGLSATVELAAPSDGPRVIVLTTFDNDELVIHALRAGAAGFLLKDTPPHRLIDAVRAAAAGEPVLSPRVAAQLIEAATSMERGDEDTRAAARRALSTLTERELEVARAVATGRTNAEIAAELFMALTTVKSHVGRALTKVGAENRVQLALLVRDADYD